MPHLLSHESVTRRALWREGGEGLGRVARAMDENVDLNEVGCLAGSGGLVVHVVPVEEEGFWRMWRMWRGWVDWLQ